MKFLSFAYLKELFLSSMMRWIATQQTETMAQLMIDQVDALRQQMLSASSLPDAESEKEDGKTRGRRFVMHIDTRRGKRLW